MYRTPIRFMKPTILTLLFTLLVSTLGTAAAQPTQSKTVKKSSKSSGIQGTIILTGNCPGPQRINDKCEPRPYQGPLAVKRSSDQEVVATVNSDSKGGFKVALPPGKYFIIQGGESRLPLIHSEEIVVSKHRFTKVKLTGDLGMR
jgi:hypothetical protein